MKSSNQPVLWKCLLTGVLAGLINGFFGTGGGMILVPLLIAFVGLQDPAAFCSSIAVILPLCIVSLVVYSRQQTLPLADALPYLPGAVAGGILAGCLFQKIPVRWLHLAMGALLAFGGIRLLL